MCAFICILISIGVIWGIGSLVWDIVADDPVNALKMFLSFAIMAAIFYASFHH